jgi:hypothetical protein
LVQLLRRGKAGGFGLVLLVSVVESPSYLLCPSLVCTTIKNPFFCASLVLVQMDACFVGLAPECGLLGGGLGGEGTADLSPASGPAPSFRNMSGG